MIEKEICESVLTIGNECRPPKGGIAQVEYIYAEELFSPFKFVSFYNGGSVFNKVFEFCKGYIKTIMFLVTDKKIKIVHIHTSSGTGMRRSSFFVALGKLFRKKIVLHMHGGGFAEYYKQEKKYADKVLRNASILIALSERWKRFYNDIGYSNVVVVPNVIETPTISYLAPSTKIHFLFLGLLCENKGIYDLLDVIALKKDDLTSKIILHVGGNGDTKRFLDYVKEKEICEIVKFEGWVSGNFKSKLLNQCDCFILPSYVEGVPISILEALAHGKFVVSTAIGGIPEIIDESDGLLFTPGNKIELWEALSYVINNIDTIRQAQSFIMMKVEQHLPYKVKPLLCEVYKGLLQNE